MANSLGKIEHIVYGMGGEGFGGNVRAVCNCMSLKILLKKAFSAMSPEAEGPFYPTQSAAIFHSIRATPQARIRAVKARSLQRPRQSHQVRSGRSDGAGGSQVPQPREP
jgi:hypothetical protein